MICPKCDFEQPDGQELCLRCGVIFAKIPVAPAQARVEPALSVWHGEERQLDRLKAVLADVPGEENSVILAGRFVVWLGLAVWGLKFMFTLISGENFSQSYMHLVNLPFHEAGHVLFSPFGRFVQVMGGTLGQLLIPMIVTVSFMLRRCNHFAVTVGLWWLGQSFMDIAPYIDDARAGQLMLLGGVTGSEVEDYHDWEYILSHLGMMQYDHLVARISFGFGLVLMATALLYGGYVLCRQKGKA